MDTTSLSYELRARLTESQAIASRATRRETQGDYEDAFALYIDAVQKYLYLIRNIPNGPLKDQLKEISSKLLNRAQNIKSCRPNLRVPHRDRLSMEEQDLVLQQSQHINKLKFPTWASTINSRRSDAVKSQLASQQPNLNPAQQKSLVDWRSIRHFNPAAELYQIKLTDPTEIVQDLVTDCSLIAAFSVLSNHSNKFHSKLHIACLHPQSPDGYPMLSEDGIYRVKLFLNGTYREVSVCPEIEMVDDRVPIGKNGSMLCAQSRKGDFYWPTLVEKAYMKVLGGYDFIGSNSSVDLHALTGWIPQSIFTTSQDYRSERCWSRIFGSFSKGDCLVTVGTNGNISHALDMVGLVPFHNYAIIDIKEDEKAQRLVTLYNAWNSLQLQSNSSATWTTDLKSALPGISIERRQELVGTFTVTWESLQIYFDAIYLNWNPSLFKFCRTAHFAHNPPPTFRLKFSPQTDSASQSEVWILLTRHFDDQSTDHEKFMSFRVFLDTDENSEDLRDVSAINYGLPPIAATALSNSTHLLSTFVPSESHASYLVTFIFHDNQTPTVLPNEKSAPLSNPIRLTLQIYSHCPIHLSDATSAPRAYVKEFEGQWATRTSGGNHALPSYMNNPMWRIGINGPSSSGSNTRKTVFQASLMAIDDQGAVDSGKSVNIKLVRAGDDGRVYDIERRDLVGDSGSYTPGSAELRVTQILPGKYTLVPSTFESGAVGPFKIKLECDLKLETIEPIPHEGAGMYKRVASSSWAEERELASHWRLTGGKGIVRIKMRLQATSEPGLYPIKLTLLQHRSPGDDGCVISPGMFTNANSGVAIGPMSILFNEDLTYSIKIEALGETCYSGERGYELIVYADKPLNLTR
ncbi:hypothetical protein O181_008915 [Austropuccinia psidii MF-1]|uniref:Calpain catalytic domain-containing protein n=1 Tax=Austropuccinia psidii MF-1 TaxID=1389203 RepID=A0A9Q3BQV5_9BASI|nr:hypothetical protein [Austropuccinia psidii MF-1]